MSNNLDGKLQFKILYIAGDLELVVNVRPLEDSVMQQSDK